MRMNQSIRLAYNDLAQNALTELLNRHQEEYTEILGGFVVDSIIFDDVEVAVKAVTSPKTSGKHGHKAVVTPVVSDKAPRKVATKVADRPGDHKMTRSESARHASEARWAKAKNNTTTTTTPRRSPRRVAVTA